MRVMLSLVASLCLAVAGVSADVQKRDIDIKAADGVVLKATYFSPGKPGPAILLLHQCNMDRHAWDGLANELTAVGFHVLAFTLRGFTDGARTIPEHPLAQWPGDIETAYAFLLSRTGVDKNRIAAGGASCGVEQSADLAVHHHEIKALLLLSGRPGDSGKVYIAATPSLPIFGAGTEGDFDPTGIQETVGASKNRQSTVKMYPGTEHGVAMFVTHPDLKTMIVQWLQAQLH